MAAASYYAMVFIAFRDCPIFGTQDSNLKGAGIVTLAGPRWGRFDLTVSA
jgi:hypothetical protein